MTEMAFLFVTYKNKMCGRCFKLSLRVCEGILASWQCSFYLFVCNFSSKRKCTFSSIPSLCMRSFNSFCFVFLILTGQKL